MLPAYPPDFFDCIIIDECHRGGAKNETEWRFILDNFASAVQIGLTATPKRTNNVDTYRHLGEPVYIYSLKEVINDGYLTPFKVRQIGTTIDEYIEFLRAPLKRSEWADANREMILLYCEPRQRELLDFVLSQYVQVGESELDDEKLPELLQLKYGSPADAIDRLDRSPKSDRLFAAFRAGGLYRAKPGDAVRR